MRSTRTVNAAAAEHSVARPGSPTTVDKRWNPLYALELGMWSVGVLLTAVALTTFLRSEVRASQAEELLPDMQLWSESRKAAYLEAIESEPAPLLGTLHMPSLDITVPVYDTASDLNMDRGSGVIDGMSYPHEPGHIGIAGHRDGFFRALKDAQVGEVLILQTINGEKRFQIDELLIVEPDDSHYLQDTVEQRLTVVTCYPFYFAGSAPQRFLVRASPVENSATITQ